MLCPLKMSRTIRLCSVLGVEANTDAAEGAAPSALGSCLGLPGFRSGSGHGAVSSGAGTGSGQVWVYRLHTTNSRSGGQCSRTTVAFKDPKFEAREACNHELKRHAVRCTPRLVRGKSEALGAGLSRPVFVLRKIELY